MTLMVMATSPARSSDSEGACCFIKSTPNGPEWRCTESFTEQECLSRQEGSWHPGVACDDIECPPVEPAGAICLETECVDGITLAECVEQFSELTCEMEWVEGETCEGITCTEPVSAMPGPWLAALLVTMILSGLYVSWRAVRAER